MGSSKSSRELTEATQACQGGDGKMVVLAVAPDFFQAGTTPVQLKENQPDS